jgi:hypothetical protein
VRRSPSHLRLLSLFGLGLILSACAGAPPAPPTPERYLQKVGGSAKIIPAGQLDLDGHKPTCGDRPTIFDDRLDDYGGAYPGFLILNPKLLTTTTTTVKLWIYGHECGHQYRGRDESAADCFAVQRGRQEKWLSPMGLDEICRFITPAKADAAHVSGAERCAAMRRCYADAR